MSTATQKNFPSRSTAPTAVIFFALGMLSAPGGGPVESRLLLNVVGELGLSEAAARSIILRLRRQELLVSERRGRAAFYAASPAAVAAQDRFTRYFRDGPPPWDGVFSGIAHNFPEEQRSERDALRRAARLAGYGVMRSGLMIAPDDRWPALRERFAAAERDGLVLRMELQLTDADPAAIARAAWSLDALAGRYRELVAAGETAVAQGTALEGGDALRALADVTMPIYEAIGEDPSLPAELLPADWPGADLGRTLYGAIRHWFPAVNRYVASLRG